MSEFEQRQKAQSNLFTPATPDRAAPQPVHSQSPTPAYHPLGNQATQRFAQSCPLRLPSPSVCPFGGTCHTCPAPMQAKPAEGGSLKINEPGDQYEQEADRVADQVMRMPEPYTHVQRACSTCDEAEAIQTKPLAEQITPLIQRQVEEEEEEEEPIQAKPGESAQVQRQEEEPEEEEEEEPLQTKRTGGQTPRGGSGLANQVHSLKDGGHPLSRSARNFFEPRFGYDFSQVCIHTGTRAEKTAKALNARAFTLGRDVVFRTGEYSPETPAGQRLLAHELAHVVQQSSGRVGRIVQRQPPNYRDCTPAITADPDANQKLENARQRAREYVGAARRRLAAAPVAGTAYATALNRHFITPNAAQRTTIRNNFNRILGTLRVNNYICNSQNICGTEQAFWIAADDLVHVCRPFWGLDRTCGAIILIHEGAHDVGIGNGAAHPPNRGSANYPAGNVAPPVGQTTAARMGNPDAYAFFAAHVWRSVDTGRTCF